MAIRDKPTKEARKPELPISASFIEKNGMVEINWLITFKKSPRRNSPNIFRTILNSDLGDTLKNAFKNE